MRICFSSSQMNAIGAFCAPLTGFRPSYPSSRQKQETPRSGLSGTHSMTNVEKSVPAHKLLSCQMRSIGILAVQTTQRRSFAPRWAICSKMPRAATAVILCGRSCDRARGSARPAAWCWPRSPGRWHARWLGAGRKPSAGCQGFMGSGARSDQFFLKLQPFVGRHGRLLPLRRQILDGRITACSRTCRGLSAHAHQ